MTPPYLESLNESQREAVEATEGPVLVLAGAGTGKTRVLTTRLGHILMTGKARPQELLAVTFTNKAAREMKDRISALIGRPVEGWWLGTFHALAARLLRRHAEVVGLTPNFTILDTDDQLRLLKQLIVAEDLDDKKWPARALLAAIERWKDRGLTPDKVTSAEQADYADGIALRLYRQYQERLGNLNACDFGDLLLHNLTLFTGNADVLRDYLATKQKNAAADTPGNGRMFVLALGRNADREERLVALLSGQGIEVFRADATFTGKKVETAMQGAKDERAFPAGSVIVYAQASTGSHSSAWRATRPDRW
jgi:superfamily I DNA/RNA helicase